MSVNITYFGQGRTCVTMVINLFASSKVNVRIIPKLHIWIGNKLFFGNMHISVILHKI